MNGDTQHSLAVGRAHPCARLDCQLLDNGKAQAGAFSGTGFVPGIEAVEEAVGVRPALVCGVGKMDQHPILLPLHLYLKAAIAVEQSVFDQVLEDALQAFPVAEYRHGFLDYSDIGSDAPACELLIIESQLLQQSRPQVQLFGLEHRLPCLQPGILEELIQQNQQGRQPALNNRKIALTSCTVPAKGTPTFELGREEMEYGVGIHGEPGIRRESLVDAHEMAGRMVGTLCKELQLKTGNGSRVALLVNGFGATPLMELYLMNNEVTAELAKRGVTLVRTFVGNFMTSIDMSGASVSLLKLDAELEALLNAQCDTPALKINGPAEMIRYNNPFAGEKEREFSYAVETPAMYKKIGAVMTLDNLKYIVDVMCDSIIRNEVPFCELDAHAGDGDFGMSIAKGFKRLKQEWQAIVEQPGLDIAGFLDACSMAIMEHCGGASGPIWGSAFRAAGKRLQGKRELRVADFADMLAAAVESIQLTGERSFGRGAVVGDKTLIDALAPCADTWKRSADSGAAFADAFRAGAESAVAGAKHTEQIVARMGRAGTVGERSLGYPDAGAHGLGVIFTDIANSLG